MFALAAMAAAAIGLAAAPLAGGAGVLGRWLGVVAAVLAVALVASGAGYLLLSTTLAEAASISLPLLLVWVAGAGIALGRAQPGVAVRAA
jgi:hypothetical protein